MSVLYKPPYVSHLSRQTPLTANASIMHLPFRHDSFTGLTDVLVFDGLNFFQHIEGPQIEVASCMARIAQDSWHQKGR